MEAPHTIDADDVRPGPADPGPHTVEHRGEVHHLRFAGRILQEGGPIGQGAAIMIFSVPVTVEMSK
jgi:hypothetical protein